MILSGMMLFEELGWPDVAASIVAGIEQAIQAGTVTYDLARQMPGSTKVSTSGFADEVVRHITGS